MSHHSFYKRQFHSNSSINPETKRRIKLGGPTYNKLCKKYGTPLLQQPLLSACNVDIPAYCGITGIKDLDKEILILLNIETLFNLYATNKTLKSVIKELLPNLLRIHNPNNDDLVVYRLMLDIFQFSDKSLIDCILCNFKNFNSPICQEIISIRDLIKNTQTFFNFRNDCIKYFDMTCIQNRLIDERIGYIRRAFTSVKNTINFVEGIRNINKSGNELIDYYISGVYPKS
jgi:hypothetical protein